MVRCRPAPKRISFESLGKVFKSMGAHIRSVEFSQAIRPLSFSGTSGDSDRENRSRAKEMATSQFIRYVLIECGYAPFAETVHVDY